MVSQDGCLVRIRSIMDRLSPAERRVAACVLDDPEAAYFSSGLDLAERAGVSEASVIRFIRSAQFRSILEFKLALSADLVRMSTTADEPHRSDRSPGSVVSEITDAAIRTLTDTKALIDQEKLEAAAETLAQARRIFSFGVGSSGCIARYLQIHLMQLGLPAHSDADVHLQATAAAGTGPGDVLIVTSFSGATEEMIEILQLAHEEGASSIALTASARSPVSEVATITLTCSKHSTALVGRVIRSSIGLLHIADLLLTEVALKTEDQLAETRARAMKGPTRLRTLRPRRGKGGLV